MLKLDFERSYVRDLKRLKHDHYPIAELETAIDKISNEQSLREYYDHALTGDMQGLRELHVDRKKRSNWLLLYEIAGDTAIMIKTGSHDYVTGK